MDTEIVGGVPVVNGKEVSFSNWADQVYWPKTTKTLPEVVSTKEEAAAESARVNKYKRPNDIRTYPVKAGQTIHAGDVVDVVGGEVGRTWRAEANVETVFQGATVISTATERLSDLYSVAAATASDNAFMRVSVFDNASGKVLKTLDIAVSTNGTATAVSLARMSDSTFIVEYTERGKLYAQVCSFVNGNLSADSKYEISSYMPNPARIKVISLSETRFISVHGCASWTKSVVGTISGNVISAGSEQTAATAGTNPSATRLPDLDGNKRVCVCFSDGSDGNKGKAVIATVNPDNTVEWGTVVTFNSAKTYMTSCAVIESDIAVAYVADSTTTAPTAGFAQILNVIGNAITGGNPVEPMRKDYPTNVSNIDMVSVFGQLVVLCGPNNSSHGSVSILVNRIGNSLSAVHQYKFDSSVAWYISAAAIDDNRVICAYSDGANSNYGTATILEVQGDQIAGIFTDASSQAIALQDATSGQPCEVIFDGVAELPGLAAGTEINSPGVYGYCPEEGRVWVRPEWDGKPYVTGKYVGNYSSSAPTQDNKIALGFRPRFVLVSIPNFSNLNVSFAVDEGTTSNNSVKIVDDGFTVSGQNMNQVNGVYGFAAFK